MPTLNFTIALTDEEITMLNNITHNGKPSSESVLNARARRRATQKNQNDSAACFENHWRL
ncbi:hypothetical protein FACS1894200_14220 [Spirochaetia bacterium]|nr:hypothetical protein FACS1894200_14220 [Spirochaetia bacterium]